MSDIKATSRWRTVIVWFRRDLRIHDHPALRDAVENAARVYPLFVFDEPLLSGRWPSPNRISFTRDSATELDAALHRIGSRLYVRRGRPAEVVFRVHEPWRMTLETQQRVGCVIGRDYPAPIVDHAEARARALNAFRG